MILVTRPSRRCDFAESDEKAAWSERSLLEALVANSPEAIRIIDRDGIVRLWNSASEALYGWSAAEAIGRPPLSVGTASSPRRSACWQACSTGRRVLDLVVAREHKAGRRLDVLVSTVPVFDEAGKRSRCT